MLDNLLILLNNKYFYSLLVIFILAIYIVNIMLNNRYNNNKIINSPISKNNISITLQTIFFILILFITLCILLNIPVIGNITNIINLSFLTYIMIYNPIFSKKSILNFEEDGDKITSFLFTELIMINTKNHSTLIKELSNATLSFNMFFYLFISLFIILYILAINIRKILYVLTNNIFKKYESLLNYISVLLCELYDDKKTNNIYPCKSIFIFIKDSFSVIFYIIIINTLIIIIKKIISHLISLFKNKEDYNLKYLSKLALIITIFITYIMIRILNLCDATFISSYEFIASTIIIPILLEGFIYNHNIKYL